MSELPDKQTADKLVAGYLTTSEAFYRVIHRPTFEKEYEALWSLESPRDTVFVLQLKLVLAIGATVFDDQFTMRSTAIQWVSEAQMWASEPKFKSRLNMQSIQTDILLLIAQDRVGVHGKAAWVSAGAIMRKALHMGLHRDPSSLPPKSFLVSEMRRRLWNTLLELDTQYSFSFGGPALVTMDSFDTEPPANLDDEQLHDETPSTNAVSIYTHMSTALALRESLPTRLSIIQLLNSLHSPQKYETTLKLDSDLRVLYKLISRRLNGCRGKDGKTKPSKLELNFLHVVMSRYISALHAPYVGPSRCETTFAYSRKVVLESALRTWHTLCPSEYLNDGAMRVEGLDFSEDREWFRLAICSSGFYPVAAMSAAFQIGTELIMQIQDDEHLGPVLLRPDLLNVLNDVEKFCTRVIEAGETNIKGCLLMNVIAAYTRALSEDADKDQLSVILLDAVHKTQAKCMQLLEAMLQSQDGNKTDEVSETLRTRGDTANDWRYMVRLKCQRNIESGLFIANGCSSVFGRYTRAELWRATRTSKWKRGSRI